MKTPPLSRLTSMSDEEICQRMTATSDEKLMGELYNRYGHLVYGTCLKYLSNTEESKDLVSIIFEKLIKKIPESNIKVFKHWLYTVSKRECLMYIRKHKTYDKLKSNIRYIEEKSQQEAIALSDINFEMEHYLIPKRKNEQELIKEALSTLKDEQRRCIQLFFFENQSYKSIMELTGFSNKQVKSYLQNGKRKIKQYLINHHTNTYE